MLQCFKNFALSRKWVILQLDKSRVHIVITRITTEIPIKQYLMSMQIHEYMKDMRQ